VGQEAGAMTAKSDQPMCSRCGNPIPPDAPGGECPRCLLGAVAAFTEPPAPPPVHGEWPTLEEVQAAFPDFEIEGEIGRGGMAVVFKARQVHLDRPVALKILAPWLAAEPGFAERFSREARVLAKLNHPNIVTIHDFGQAARFFYLLMEYVDGVNLRQAMQAGRFAPSQALGLVPKICDALQYAHSEGVLHRDIKPDNILLDARGRVKIADFGIAKLAGEPEAAMSLTRSGMHLGTPAYMAPEQVEKPADVDHRADIYSLGVVLYEMLTGELPLGRFAAPSEKSSVDARIDEIVFRTLEKERERRYQSAEEVKTKVEGLGGPPPPPAVATASGAAGGHSAAGRSSVNDPLSRKAVVGAVATGLSLCVLAVLVPTWTMPVMRVSHGPMDAPPPTAPTVLLTLVLVLVLAGFAISTLSGLLLGASALSDIHRSGGRRRGAGLAAFAVLTWPLMILTGAGAGLSAKLGEVLFDEVFRVAGREWLKMLVVVVGLGAVVWLDVGIIRRVLRWARGGANGGPVGPPPLSATAATVAAPVPAPAGGSPPKTSGLALASGILALISLLPAVFLIGLVLVALVMAGGRMPVGGGLGVAEMGILFFVGGMNGLLGMILGLVAMRRIRDAHGRLGGVGWAVLGGMSWFAVALFAIGLMMGAAVARSVPGPLGGIISFGLALGLPGLLSGKLFRAAASWTSGGAFAGRASRREWWAVGIGVLVVAIAGALAGARMRRDGGSTFVVPAAVTGDFTVDGGTARVEVNDATQTTEWTQARPVQVHRLILNVAATLASHRQLVVEVRHTLPDGREATVRRLDDATLLTGELAGGAVTVHRNFELELPESAGTEALEEAHRQINGSWRHRRRAVFLARPESLLRIALPDGSTFEAFFILQPVGPPAEAIR